jgi:hypothetical protein
MRTKIRTTIITLIAAGSIVPATIGPTAAEAMPVGAAGITQDEIEKGGGTCEHVGTDFWECKDKDGKKWYCNHEGCQSVKIVVGTSDFRATIPTLSAFQVAAAPPVVKKVTHHSRLAHRRHKV